jgi:hypothetical protein
MTRSFWRSTLRAAVVVPALLVVLLAAPIPVAAAPEGELTWVAVYVSWTPTGELAFLSGAASEIERRGSAPIGALPSLALHAPLESRK